MHWKRMLRLGVLASFVLSTSLMFADHRTTGARGRFKTFQQLDRNNNGAIESYEWDGDPGFFRWLDADHSGTLSTDEYFQRSDEFERAQPFYAWDTDRDGRISRQEWKSNPNLFMELDRNEDSYLTTDEFMARSIDKRFREYDRNGDELISRNEWTDDPAEFESLDTNNDGRLSPEEYFLRGGRAELEKRFHAWDVNGDGNIQGNEWHAPSRLFHQLDTDHNSVLSFDEFMSVGTGRERTTNVERDREGDFNLLDWNNDGVITRDEWRGSASSFYRMDSDGDGVISYSEFSSSDRDRGGRRGRWR